MEEFEITSKEEQQRVNKWSQWTQVIKEAKTKAKAIETIGEDGFNEFLRFMYEAHPKGLGMTTLMMAEKLDKPLATVRLWLHQLEDRKLLKMRPRVRPPYAGKLVKHRRLEREGIELVGSSYMYVMYTYPDQSLCYIIGFCVGDGSVERTWKRTPYRIVICNTNWSLLEPVFKRAKKVANKFRTKAVITYHDRDGHKVPREKAYAWYIRISSSTLARIISSDEEGFGQRTLDTLLSPDFIGDFLAGLWDADGYVYLRNKEMITSLRQAETNLSLLYRIHQALGKVGIPTSKPTLIIRGAESPRMIAGRPAIFKKAVYEIRVLAGGMPKWVQSIGKKMIHPEKILTIRMMQEIVSKKTEEP